MRLQKYLAQSGVASRRRSEEMIRDGLVQVNGTVIREMGFLVDPEQDHVKVQGKSVHPVSKKFYILLNKPAGVVTTADDPFGRETVLDLLEGRLRTRVYPVGRLDYETEGLLLLTNDGELTNRILHPASHLPKKYQVVIRGRLSREEMDSLEAGVVIDGYMTAPAQVKLIGYRDKKTEIQMTIREGKNRQVRKMIEGLGHEVAYLKRIAIGPIMDEFLEKGAWRHLTDEELKRLQVAVEKAERHGRQNRMQPVQPVQMGQEGQETTSADVPVKPAKSVGAVGKPSDQKSPGAGAVKKVRGKKTLASRPSSSKSSTGAPSERKSTGGKPGAGKPSVGKSVEGKSAVGKSGAGKASERKAAGAKSSVEKSEVGKPSVGKPSERKAGDRKVMKKVVVKG